MATYEFDENEWEQLLESLEGEAERARARRPPVARRQPGPQRKPFRPWRLPPFRPPVRVYPPLVTLPLPYPLAPPAPPAGAGAAGDTGSAPTCSCPYGTDDAAEPPAPDADAQAGTGTGAE
jgi:hypothetical protein